jgi:hypothetical protein
MSFREPPFLRLTVRPRHLGGQVSNDDTTILARFPSIDLTLGLPAVIVVQARAGHVLTLDGVVRWLGRSYLAPP